MHGGKVMYFLPYICWWQILQIQTCLSVQIQNPFLTAQSTQIKSVISVPIKDFIHHYPRALFNDIPRVGAHFYDIPGRDALLRHTRVGAQFNDIPGSLFECGCQTWISLDIACFYEEQCQPFSGFAYRLAPPKLLYVFRNLW